jgi:hypothetical protein
MTDPTISTWVGAAVQGIVVGAGFLVAAIMAVTVLLGARKLRHRGRAGARSLDELVDSTAPPRYLPPEAPRGPIDQLGAGTSAGRVA